MSESSEIRRAMEQSAQHLTTLPSEEWAEGVAYLLEALEGGADTEPYREFLETLRLIIITRLEENTW